MDPCEDSNKGKDDGEGSKSDSNDIFIASGPYFAQFNGSVTEDHLHRFDQPSTSSAPNCSVVFSNIENLSAELCNATVNDCSNILISKPGSSKNDPTIVSETNSKHSKGLKKFLQPFGSHSHHKNQDTSTLKQSKQLSSSTVEISLVGSHSSPKGTISSLDPNNNTRNNVNDNNNAYKKAHPQSALKKLLSTSQELFHSKSKTQSNQTSTMNNGMNANQQQPSSSNKSPNHHPTLLSIGVASSLQTSHLPVPSTSGTKSTHRNDRPRSSHENYNSPTDLQTVPEDYKSAFQQVFTKRPKVSCTNSQCKLSAVDKRHNRSKSLSQNICSSSTDSDEEVIMVQGGMVTSQRDEDLKEPIHMTLEEVRAMMSKNLPNEDLNNLGGKHPFKKSKLKQAFQHLLHKTHCITNPNANIHSPSSSTSKSDNTQSFPQLETEESSESNSPERVDLSIESIPSTSSAPPPVSPFGQRALPPVPRRRESNKQRKPQNLDSFTSFHMRNLSHEQKELRKKEKYLLYLESISRVKECGWYWGPVSGEMAEKLLKNEPCGSFIVRDSSDEHYIFSLTFKLNGQIRHVRIQHDHGNFSFGPGRRYKNNTIVEFIEDAIEHSRTGQFLFFLHRFPIDGPDGVMRIQLLNPVSRFRSMQSLQHLCRFAILKMIRRDETHLLDVPDMIKMYLDTPFYFSEELPALHDGPPPLSDQVKWITAKKRQQFLRARAQYDR